MPPRWRSPSTVGTHCSCGSSVAPHQALWSAAMTSMQSSVSATSHRRPGRRAGSPARSSSTSTKSPVSRSISAAVARGDARPHPVGELAEEADLALVHVERHRHGPVGDRRGGALDDDRRDRPGFAVVVELEPGDHAEHPGALTDRLGPEAADRVGTVEGAGLAELRRQPRRGHLAGLASGTWSRSTGRHLIATSVTSAPSGRRQRRRRV